MTAYVVKETLRKCPSDPARLSTTAPSTTSPKSPLSPSAKSVASTSKSSSSTSALHLAPFSKCVLTLDGYNYVISKSDRKDSSSGSIARVMKTPPGFLGRGSRSRHYGDPVVDSLHIDLVSLFKSILAF